MGHCAVGNTAVIPIPTARPPSRPAPRMDHGSGVKSFAGAIPNRQALVSRDFLDEIMGTNRPLFKLLNPYRQLVSWEVIRTNGYQRWDRGKASLNDFTHHDPEFQDKHPEGSPL
eukprot:g58109.t1